MHRADKNKMTAKAFLIVALLCVPVCGVRAETRLQHDTASRIGTSMAFSSIDDAQDVSHSFSMHGDMVDGGAAAAPQAKAVNDPGMIFDGADTGSDSVPVVSSTPTIVPDDPALKAPAPSSAAAAAMAPNTSQQAASPGPAQIEGSNRAPELPDPSIHDVRQQLWQEWAEKFQLLQDENTALRDKLRMTQGDGLQDIRVDSVALIEQQALKSRIADLEKEVEQLRAKKTASTPNANANAAGIGTLGGSGATPLARTHAD